MFRFGIAGRRVAPGFCAVLMAATLTAGCGGGGTDTTGAATPATPTAATPAPTQTASSITIDGVAKTPVAIDTLVTRSGHWKFSDLGAVGANHAYLWRLDENADFLRVMICRRPALFENNDSTVLTLQTSAVVISDRGHSYNWSLTMAPGACRVMQNIEPVAPHPEWLRDAVATHRIPAYRRERAWLAGLPALALDPQRGAYDPASLGPIPGSTDTPTANNNYVGVTSAQGGEYASSRGFLHNVDARVLDAALHSEDSAVASFMPEFTQYTWYSLSQPNGGVWSTTNNTTVDPQFPTTGDHPYEYATAGQRVRPDIDSVLPIDGWSRDDAHLEDTGFVHWMLTEDPVAGMVVQRQLAFALANYFEYQRANPAVTYGVQIIQERGAFNAMSALWKSRDVARRVASTSGTVIWSTARVDRMVSEGIASIDTQVNASPYRDIAAVTGVAIAQIFEVPWMRTDGGTTDYAAASNFMLVQYGKEPLWLFTKDGNATTMRWFTQLARQLVVRTLYIGGTYGVDGAQDIRGSQIPLGPTTTDQFGFLVPAPTPFRTDIDWANWMNALPIVQTSKTNYDGAAAHTAIQFQGMLLLAKDANVPASELDAAIARVEQYKAATTNIGFAGLQMHKHLASPQ